MNVKGREKREEQGERLKVFLRDEVERFRLMCFTSLDEDER